MDLEGIFRAHQREVFVYFLRTTGERHRAEDLSQETFTRACESALRFRGEASARTWLFAIARNVLAEHYRRRGSELLGEVPETPHLDDPGARLGVEEALRALPVTSRDAVVLCDVLGFAPGEAAEVAGIDANAFRVRLHRARKQFREVYGDDV